MVSNNNLIIWPAINGLIIWSTITELVDTLANDNKVTLGSAITWLCCGQRKQGNNASVKERIFYVKKEIKLMSQEEQKENFVSQEEYLMLQEIYFLTDDN